MVAENIVNVIQCAGFTLYNMSGASDAATSSARVHCHKCFAGLLQLYGPTQIGEMILQLLLHAAEDTSTHNWEVIQNTIDYIPT